MAKDKTKGQERGQRVARERSGQKSKGYGPRARARAEASRPGPRAKPGAKEKGRRTTIISPSLL